MAIDQAMVTRVGISWTQPACIRNGVLGYSDDCDAPAMMLTADFEAVTL